MPESDLSICFQGAENQAQQNASQLIRDVWADMPFFGTRAERFVARYWIVVMLVPYAILIALGFWDDSLRLSAHTFSSVTSFVRGPYTLTLGIALFLSGLAFKIWERTMRDTFSTVIDTGVVGGTAADQMQFVSVSNDFAARMRSRWRFLASSVIVLVTAVVNWGVICSIPGEVPGEPLSVTLFLVLMLVSFFMFSYAVGAVAWCLVSAARWITNLSKTQLLKIQPGHSDGCCGLESVGDCCLQSVIPLLIGMVLCVVWSKSGHLAFFEGHVFGPLIPASYAMMATFFLIACALVFLPIMGPHKRMEEFKRAREIEFTRALEVELAEILNALSSDNNDQVKSASDRLKLVQALDPVVLKLSTWPFDRASLIKYAVAPIGSLAASFGKDVVKAPWQ